MLKPSPRDAAPASAPSSATESGARPRMGELPEPPVRGDAFTSPLLMPPRESVAAPSARRGLWILGGALSLSTAAIAAALMVRDSRLEQATVAPEAPPAATTSAAPALRPSGAAVAAGPAVGALPAPAEPTGAQASAAPAPSAATASPTADTAADIARPSEPQAEPHAQPAVRESGKERRARLRAERRAARRARAAAAERERARALPAQPSRAEVLAAMKRVTPAVNACFGDARGVAKVALSVRGKSGRVASARVTGQRGDVGSCIARAVRRAKFPKFAKPELDIAYPFKR